MRESASIQALTKADIWLLDQNGLKSRTLSLAPSECVGFSFDKTQIISLGEDVLSVGSGALGALSRRR